MAEGLAAIDQSRQAGDLDGELLLGYVVLGALLGALWFATRWWRSR